MHLSHGDLSGALIENPLFAVIMILTFLYFILSSFSALANLPRFIVLLSRLERRLLSAAICTLVIANWAYQIAR